MYQILRYNDTKTIIETIDIAYACKRNGLAFKFVKLTLAYS